MAQQSIASLPEGQQGVAMERTEIATRKYPSVNVAGHGLHVCEMDGEWEVWVNCEDADFTGLCVGFGLTRDIAVARAVRVLEAVLAKLQGPARA